MHVGGIFYDLRKAFDCVNHEILLVKLHVYGIPGVWEDWFKSYFTNIWQKVEVKSPNRALIFFSYCSKLKHGVPQGLILGPLLFIIYINDLPLGIHSVSEPRLFADDTSVIISSRHFEDFSSMSNLVLSCMIKCFAANNLVLNLNKTNIIKFITSNISHYTLHIGYKENK